jgi:hypothetical protein
MQIVKIVSVVFTEFATKSLSLSDWNPHFVRLFYKSYVLVSVVGA